MTISLTQEVLSYFPELTQHLKQASDLSEVFSGFPTDTPDHALISALKVGYMEKVAHVSVSPTISVVVKKAARLYGLSSAVDAALENLSKNLMEKSASEQKFNYQIKEASQRVQDMYVAKKVDGLLKVARSLDLSDRGHQELSKVAELSAYLPRQSLNKDAVIHALTKRAFMSGVSDYNDLIQVLKDKDFQGFTKEACTKVLDSIHSVDTQYGLSVRGCDIYRESMVKVAEDTISLCGKSVSLNAILDVLPALQDALGKDIVKEILDAGQESGPIIMSLPTDLKAIIGKYV